MSELEGVKMSYKKNTGTGTEIAIPQNFSAEVSAAS